MKSTETYKKVTIDPLKRSDEFPFGMIVEFTPQNSITRIRTDKQRKARERSKMQKASRKINR